MQRKKKYTYVVNYKSPEFYKSQRFDNELSLEVVEINGNRFGPAENETGFGQDEQSRKNDGAEKINVPQRVEGQAAGPGGSVVAQNFCHPSVSQFMSHNGYDDGNKGYNDT